jgi:hypothetical protein
MRAGKEFWIEEQQADKKSPFYNEMHFSTKALSSY